MSKDITIILTPDILQSNILPLSKELKRLLGRGTSREIRLEDLKGNKIACQVLHKDKCLYAPGLGKFLTKLGTSIIRLIFVQAGVLVVAPAEIDEKQSRPRYPKAGQGNPEMLVEKDCRPSSFKAEPVVKEQLTLFTEITGEVAVALAREDSVAAAAGSKLPRSPETGVQVAAKQTINRSQATTSADTSCYSPKGVSVQAERHDQPRLKSKPGSDPAPQTSFTANSNSKPLRKGKAKLQKNSLLQERPGKNTFMTKPSQATGGFSGQTLPAAAEEKPAKPKVPLKVNFAHDQDRAILDLAVANSGSPLSDLFLHRQALFLSICPGFDTLLSLGVVREVQLLDYQLSTVRHVLANLRGRALLCDEVGLGKTIEAGLIMMEYLLRGLVRRVLVLAPPSLVEQWREEMQVKFNQDFMSYDAAAFKNHPRPWASFPYIIASLDTAKRSPHREQILAVDYDLVIVDEAHHLKNQRTLAYQLVGQIKKKYILLLTATPVQNDLQELFNLITLLMPGQLETAASFKRKYINRGDPLKPRNTETLKKLIREVMVRNRRSETGVIHSRRYAEVIELDLSPEEMVFYRRLTSFVRGYYTAGAKGTVEGANQFVLKTLQREVGSSMEAVLPTLEKIAANPDNPEPLRRVSKMLAEQGRQVPRRAKAEALLQLMQKIPDKAIIFTSFRETQRFLAEELRRQGLMVAELHGGMRRQEKEEQVRYFADTARVLVATETGSEGRNLQFCRTMINYDLPWNPMRIEQRIGRIHRLGQKQDVFIYNLAAAGTVEAYILELLDAKINMFQLVVGELDLILGNLQEKKDFEDIIMEIWARAHDEQELKKDIEQLGEQLVAARQHYQAVRELDDHLLGVLLPDE